MMLWIKHKRKNGKYKVIFGTESGVRRTKILTQEQLDVYKNTCEVRY